MNILKAKKYCDPATLELLGTIGVTMRCNTCGFAMAGNVEAEKHYLTALMDVGGVLTFSEGFLVPPKATRVLNLEIPKVMIYPGGLGGSGSAVYEPVVEDKKWWKFW